MIIIKTKIEIFKGIELPPANIQTVMIPIVGDLPLRVPWYWWFSKKKMIEKYGPEISKIWGFHCGDCPSSFYNSPRFP